MENRNRLEVLTVANMTRRRTCRSDQISSLRTLGYESTVCDPERTPFVSVFEDEALVVDGAIPDDASHAVRVGRPEGDSYWVGDLAGRFGVITRSGVFGDDVVRYHSTVRDGRKKDEEAGQLEYALIGVDGILPSIADVEATREVVVVGEFVFGVSPARPLRSEVLLWGANSVVVRKVEKIKSMLTGRRSSLAKK